MQPPPQLAVSTQLDENVFVQRQADEVEGLLDWIAIVGVGHCYFSCGAKFVVSEGVMNSVLLVGLIGEARW